MILERTEPCSSRSKATPTPELGYVSLGEPHQEYNLVKDKDRCTIKDNDMSLKNRLSWLFLHFSLVLEILVFFKRL